MAWRLQPYDYLLYRGLSYTVNGITSSYRRVGTANTLNTPPTNTTYWNVIAQGSSGTNGINGNWVSYAFRQSTTQPTTPTGTAPVPSGWSDAPTSTGKYWMSKATISGSTGLAVSSWSTPIQVTGEDGNTGNYIDFKYRVNTSPTTAPALSSSSRNPSGWSDTPPTLSTGQFLWMIQAEINASNVLVGIWSTPVRISGEKGNTGDKGDTGDNGLVGPGIVYRGEWAANTAYYNNTQRRDVVVRNPTTTNKPIIYTKEPTGL